MLVTTVKRFINETQHGERTRTKNGITIARFRAGSLKTNRSVRSTKFSPMLARFLDYWIIGPVCAARTDKFRRCEMVHGIMKIPESVIDTD